MLWLIVQERETNKWYVIREMPYETFEEYNIRTNRRKKIRKQVSYIYPKPEQVSCFIKDHAVIEAKTREKAWELTSSFQKPK